MFSVTANVVCALEQFEIIFRLSSWYNYNNFGSVAVGLYGCAVGRKLDDASGEMARISYAL